jgi:hypothetical protein
MLLNKRFFMVSVLLLLMLVPSLVQAAPLPQQQETMSGSFTSTKAVVAPLEPVMVNVTVVGYQGPATLLIFDSAGQTAGAWEFAIPAGGNTTVTVSPRGKLGEHIGVLYASGVEVAHAPIYRLDAHTSVHTGVTAYDQLYPRVHAFMQHDVLEYWLDGHFVRGYRSPDSPLLWLRDHYYQGRGFRYFETDVTSLVDAFRRYQSPTGSFPDFLARPDYGIDAHRTPVEADVEYLFVLAVYEAWQMTGDDQWMIANLPAMQKAIDYTTSSSLRWEPNVGLVKRPYTIDTWDFEYGETTIDPTTGLPAPRHWIDEHTKWGIFHGDNTGLAKALRVLAEMEAYVGQPEKAQKHRKLADDIIQRLNWMSWNGSFYRHHVKLEPWDVPGVDEDYQLSLSNAYALNRGVLTTQQARAILYEYRSRLRRPGNVSFAEWWSIDPPFPQGSFGMAGRLGERPGFYVNGGIMPLVGGELSRGAFRYGYEEYGFDILERYYDLIARTNATYLWYHPTGGPGSTGMDVLSTDGWGSSAMLAGLMEGAAGVEDDGVRYSKVTLSPRWSASAVSNAYIVTRYAASDGYVAYRWRHVQEKERDRSYLHLEVTGSGEWLTVRLLLPPEALVVNEVILNGQSVPIGEYTQETIGSSRYVVLNNVPNGIVNVQVNMKSQ